MEPVRAEWTPFRKLSRIERLRKEVFTAQRAFMGIAILAILAAAAAPAEIRRILYVVIVALWGWTMLRSSSSERLLAPGHAVRSLMAEHPVGFPVLLTVFRGAEATGQDAGVCWIEDGMLVFVGQHTSFRMNRRDASVPDGSPRAEEPDRTARGFRVLDGLDSRVILYPLPAPNKAKFAEAIDDWLNFAPGSEAESLLPPFGPMPGWNWQSSIWEILKARATGRSQAL